MQPLWPCQAGSGVAFLSALRLRSKPSIADKSEGCFGFFQNHIFLIWEIVPMVILNMGYNFVFFCRNLYLWGNHHIGTYWSVNIIKSA